MKVFDVKLVFRILVCLLAISVVSARAVYADAVDDAVASFKRLESYRVTLVSQDEIIKYFYKKPGFIRMEFERPHKGAVLVFDPEKREVRLRPFRFWKSFEMLLKPEDSLIKSEKGHTVDKSDIGSLLENVEKLKTNGLVETKGIDDVNGRKAVVVEVAGAGSFTTYDGVNRYRLWLDSILMLPVKVQAYSATGELMEEVLMEDLDVNPALSAELFS